MEHDVYKIKRTGYRLKVLTYQTNEEPTVIIDVHDPSGTVIDRAVITAPVVSGQQPKLNIKRPNSTKETTEEVVDDG